MIAPLCIIADFEAVNEFRVLEQSVMSPLAS